MLSGYDSASNIKSEGNRKTQREKPAKSANDAGIKTSWVSLLIWVSLRPPLRVSLCVFSLRFSSDLQEPVKTGTSANADINVRPAGPNDAFAFLWQGFISIPAPGNYTFETISDDGSKFYFNTFYNPGTAAMVNNDGLHPATSATGTITIANAGVYPIAITYFEQYGGQSMELYWTGPGITRQRIPNDAFALVNQSLLPSYPFIGTARQQSEAVKPATAVAETTNLRSVYPNPFGESITVDFYNSVSTNDISIGLYDLNGRMVLTNHAGRLPAGNNIIKMNLSGINIKEGVYIVQVTKNGIAWKTAKVVKKKK